MGDRIGYARVSTKEQNIDSQLDQLAKEGCIKVITDTVSGTTKDRPGWNELMEYLRTGDTVVVTELSRMSRSFVAIPYYPPRA
jgi:DNA invertase Pin-like site-specific DNA recombinase